MEVQLRDVTMQFNDITAVDRLNVTIKDGELVSMLGPSGCGKSTTLFMLAGLYRPTGGEILFGDRLVNKIEPEHREIGMVFQNYALYPHLTVLKNIMFPLKMRKTPKKEAEELAIQMAKLVQIDHLLDRKPGQLSGGQQQRVAIARALVKKPKILLLDEPLSNLDARLRLEMREEIRRIQQEVKITTIFVTHDQEEAMSISDKILLMKDGKFQQYSPPQEMYDHPENEFVAGFLGSPPINLFSCSMKYNLKDVSISGTDDVITLSSALKESVSTNDQLTLGVRPEDFYIERDENKPGICGKTIMVERIGRDNMLNVEVQNKTIRAIVSPDCPVGRGDIVKLGILPGRAHLFDAQTGENLLDYKTR
ncbi:ABC transporter ATP-binding protein [Lederbergia citrea]|uniref:ABC transporter ATP-binding protein n=1 Tax=Lederbergia citrea TaxID=2833581 RepID=A0A942US73_9BACI|nr:ABC transporter ATP-binding protein [Lederbergia citrea]MBS4177670.1 ABC transporter ATP-binding protein [Lederbergia citrea]MBS4204349.1 ABC transporter ATP-binding protein [Lederbergia citrea]MBS4223808.1 ABC transporter ATP-binding protein [Lederbergia citrea]